MFSSCISAFENIIFYGSMNCCHYLSWLIVGILNFLRVASDQNVVQGGPRPVVHGVIAPYK